MSAQHEIELPIIACRGDDMQEGRKLLFACQLRSPEHVERQFSFEFATRKDRERQLLSALVELSAVKEERDEALNRVKELESSARPVIEWTEWGNATQSKIAARRLKEALAKGAA